MRRSNRWTTYWGLFLFSSSAAVLLLLGLGSSSSSSLVEAAATRTGANRRAVRKTTKERLHHQQRNLQSGKGGKGSSSGEDINNNAGLPSGMLATIGGTINAMNYGIFEHQNNAKKSTKGSSSGGLYPSDNINYGNGGSTPTTDPVLTNPTTGTIIQPNQGGSPVGTSEGTIIVGDSTEGPADTDSSTNNPSTGTIAVDSAGIDDPQDPTNPSVVPPTSGTTNESFFGGTTTVPDNQQDVSREKDEEHISTDQFVNLGDEDADYSDQSDNADGKGDNNVVIITPGHDDTTNMNDETSAGLPDFEYGSNINDYSPNQPGKEDKKETSTVGDGEFQRLDMPEGLVVSIFLSEEEARRLQASPTDPLKNQEEFELVLNGMGETEITIQNYLARHLNAYLLKGISGLSFVSIDSIAAFLTTKFYQGRPTPAIVVKSIEGTTTYRGVEKPSPRALEASTLGAFNTIEGRNTFINNFRDSDDNTLSRTIDVSAEINRGAITPSSDAASPIVNAATQNDIQLRMDGGSAARVSGIAIGGLIIVVAMFVVGHKLVRRSKDEIEPEDEDSLEHKYDLDSIESETACSSALVSYHSRERNIASHHRDLMTYDDSASYPKGTLVLSPVAEGPIAEEMIDDLVITEKIQIVAEEPQKKEKVPSPLLRKLYSFSPSSLRRAALDNGLHKEMAAKSILGPVGSAYDMSVISPSTSDDTDETPQEQSPDTSSDGGKSALLLEDGLASRGPDPPTAELNETVDTSRAVMAYSHSKSTSEEEDQNFPSTIDVDAVDSDAAARRLGLGIRSFSDVKEEDEEDRRVVKSSPKPIATPERRARPSPAKALTQSTIPYVPRAPMTAKNTTANEKGQENKLYDPIFVNGKVQMKERSPPYRHIFRK